MYRLKTKERRRVTRERELIREGSTQMMPRTMSTRPPLNHPMLEIWSHKRDKKVTRLVLDPPRRSKLPQSLDPSQRNLRYLPWRSMYLLPYRVVTSLRSSLLWVKLLPFKWSRWNPILPLQSTKSLSQSSVCSSDVSPSQGIQRKNSRMSQPYLQWGFRSV